MKKEAFLIKLSIIIPYYKTLKLTKTLLENLYRQKTAEVEIIVIDDGCYETELDKYPITVIHQDNAGVSAARNKGLDIAKGKYIAFIDSDDNVADNYIDTWLKEINKGDFDYGLHSWRATGKLKGTYKITDMPPSWNTSVWNGIYKRSAIGKTRFDETKHIAEDEQFNKIVRKGKKVNVSEVLYIYNSGREDSLTDLYSKKIITRDRNTMADINTQILIYQEAVGPIGGIETFLYEFFKALKDDYDIVFMYKGCHEEQLRRYKKLVRCEKFTGQQIECDVYINCRVAGHITQNVKAKKYIQMLHADFGTMGWKYKKNPKIDTHVAVSEVAKESVQAQIDGEVNVIYNLLDVDKTQKVLHLVSPTRLSREKGYKRMKQMAKQLNRLNIPFVWQVFTTDLPDENIDGLIFRKSSFSVRDYIKDADYLVQLSDCEAWGYTLAEALELGTPVITTDIKVLSEMGIKDGENGYILKRDMSNLDDVIKKITGRKLKKFTYNKRDDKSQWKELFGKLEEKQTEYIPPNEVKLRILKEVQLVVENRLCKKDQTIWVCDKARADMIVDAGFAEIIKENER